MEFVFVGYFTGKQPRLRRTRSCQGCSGEEPPKNPAPVPLSLALVLLLHFFFFVFIPLCAGQSRVWGIQEFPGMALGREGATGRSLVMLGGEGAASAYFGTRIELGSKWRV